MKKKQNKNKKLATKLPTTKEQELKTKTITFYFYFWGNGSYYTNLHYDRCWLCFSFSPFFIATNIPTNNSNIKNDINFCLSPIIKQFLPFKLHNWVCSTVCVLFCVAVVLACLRGACVLTMLARTHLVLDEDILFDHDLENHNLNIVE